MRGEFLGNLASNQLEMLDVSHSEHIESHQVLECVKLNKKQITKLKVDGETAQTKQLCEMLNSMHAIHVFSVRFCPTLEDEILDCLSENIERSNNMITKLVLRKG